MKEGPLTRWAHPYLLLLSTLVFASCGGGGSGSPSPPPRPTGPPPITHTITASNTSAESVAYLNVAVKETFSWSFSTTGSTSAQERYTLTSSPEGVTFSDGDRVSHGMTVDTGVSYQCSEVGVVNFQITLTIISSGATQAFDWSVDCQLDPDDLITLTARFYQGPLLGIMEISQTPDGWFIDKQEHTWPHWGELHDHTLSLNRQTFVEIDIPRLYDFDADITVSFPNLAEGETAARFLLATRQQNVGEGEEQTIQFIRRVVYDVSRFGTNDANIMEIAIEPIPELPQLTSNNNVIQVNLNEFQEDVIPEMHLLIIPVRTESGVPDIKDALETGLITLRDLMPVVQTAVRVGDEVDLSEATDLDMEAVLDAINIASTEQGVRGEFVHGIVLLTDIGGDSIGIAYVGGSTGVSGLRDTHRDRNAIFAGVFAHELGHNLGLYHASGDVYIYADGTIGDEIGWRMSNRRRIEGSNPRTEHIMKAGLSVGYDLFISQQYYARAKRSMIRRIHPVSASIPPVLAQDFDLAEGRSVVLVGNLKNGREWAVFHESVVKMPPFPHETARHDHTIRIIHLNSGTELYRTPLRVHEVAHGTPDTPAGWSARLPAYKGAGLSAEILDSDGRVVFTQDLAGIEL